MVNCTCRGVYKGKKQRGKHSIHVHHLIHTMDPLDFGDYENLISLLLFRQSETTTMEEWVEACRLLFGIRGATT